MKTLLPISIKNCMLLFILLSSTCLSQGNSLQIFNQFIGKNWTGHYIDSEDSLYVHKIKWENILNSKGVKETKNVAELGFEMETYFYFDWDKNQISFLSLVNKEMNSTGKVLVDNSTIILEGKTFFNNGSNIFKKTYRINEDGKMIDSFYRKKGNIWIKGHLIEYK